MFYINTNPHPDGKNVGDCVVRAVTIATEEDYLETRRHLNRIKKELNESSYKNRKFIHKYAKLNNWEKISFPVVKGEPRMRAGEFASKYPEGTYILNMTGHVAAVSDGFLRDSWDSSNKMVYNAWKVK